MDADTARALFLPAHGVFGVVALLAGAAALSVPKRRPLHPWLGRTFVGCMAVAVVAAVPVLGATANVFLTGMGLLASALCALGFRIAWTRPRGGDWPVERAASALFGVAMLAFAAFGLRAVLRGIGFGWVPVVFGAMGVGVARSAWRFWSAPGAWPGGWVRAHETAMIAAVTAATTAFTAAIGTNWWPAIPEPVLWLAPTVIAVAAARVVPRPEPDSTGPGRRRSV